MTSGVGVVGAGVLDEPPLLLPPPHPTRTVLKIKVLRPRYVHNFIFLD